MKVATTRAELHKIQYKSILVVAEGIKLENYLRADVCKYRPEVGKMTVLKNPKKIMSPTQGILVMKI